jgi:hypothetical protein
MLGPPSSLVVAPEPGTGRSPVWSTLGGHGYGRSAARAELYASRATTSVADGQAADIPGEG